MGFLSAGSGSIAGGMGQGVAPLGQAGNLASDVGAASAGGALQGGAAAGGYDGAAGNLSDAGVTPGDMDIANALQDRVRENTASTPNIEEELPPVEIPQNAEASGMEGSPSNSIFEADALQEVSEAPRDMSQVDEAVGHEMLGRAGSSNPEYEAWFSSLDEPTQDMLINLKLHEAGNQPPEGMAMVGQIVKNRAEGTGKTPAEIMMEPKQFSHFTNSGTDAGGRPYSDAQRDAARASVSVSPGLGEGPYTHYYNPSIASPDWGPKLQNTQMIGDHRVGYLPDALDKYWKEEQFLMPNRNPMR